MHAYRLLLVIIIVSMASGCTTSYKPVKKPESAGSSGGGKYEGDNYGGGYYGGDKPPPNARDVNSIPDAIPRHESLAKTGNKPYTALGKRYVPLKSAKGYSKTGVASWYGQKFHGRRTSSGETYDMWSMTAAHPVLPLPTWVRVRSHINGVSVVVKVNDRGPFLHNRIIDLSYAAATKLGIVSHGTGQVTITAIDPDHTDVTYSESSQVYSGSAGINHLPVEDVTAAGSNIDQSEIDTSKSPDIPQYYLQVGAYKEIDNAILVRKRLQRLGFSLFPESDRHLPQQKNLHIVQVGPYDSVTEAYSVQEFIMQLMDESVHIIHKIIDKY